jgi:ADP-heptose:LPS heptosyltransferase
MSRWNSCKNVLIIRLDNMGDVLMTSPSIRAIKTNINCKITLLSSRMGLAVAGLISEIDDVIEFNSPWMKLQDKPEDDLTIDLIYDLQQRCFDGCVIFNVYSQNPLAAFMIAYLSKIPLRLGYCRENPYALLTDWIPDPEPFKIIKHQVIRDLNLLEAIGITEKDQRIRISLSETAITSSRTKVMEVIPGPNYILLHTGVSETKRRYPKQLWVEIGKLLVSIHRFSIVLTGSAAEQSFTQELAKAIGPDAYALAGEFSIEEFACLIKDAAGMISVNTGSIHLGAAVQTPMVVLYAETNPQHSPWMVNHVLMNYSVPEPLKSKNQIIEWVSAKIYQNNVNYPEPVSVVNALLNLLEANSSDFISS